MIIPTGTDPKSLACVEVSGDPDPQVSTDVTVTPGTGVRNP